MKCEKCDEYHDGTFGSGRFCSRKCANSREKTDEIRKRTSDTLKRAHIDGRISTKGRVYAEEVIQKRKETWDKKLLESDFSSLKFESIRKRVILEQNNCCNRCGICEWLNLPITLELEHIDGNRQNNSRENLEALCPNCHSMTDTWRGRNKTRTQPKRCVSNEDMVRAFLETGNIRQALLKLELAPKGANYGRVKRALSLWNIEY